MRAISMCRVCRRRVQVYCTFSPELDGSGWLLAMLEVNVMCLPRA